MEWHTPNVGFNINKEDEESSVYRWKLVNFEKPPHKVAGSGSAVLGYPQQHKAVLTSRRWPNHYAADVAGTNLKAHK